jgi:hypothetical protein
VASSLGRLVSIHGVDPAFLQRGVFIVVLSFLFFLAMMLMYYLRQGIGYFLLATAFLIIYLITMFSFVMLRRHSLHIYESGFIFRGRTVFWDQVRSASPTGEIALMNGKPVKLPRSLRGIDGILAVIRARSANMS